MDTLTLKQFPREYNMCVCDSQNINKQLKQYEIIKH